jgi:glyoxylase-like metal-dependent hydrolase (beta-lactamase superfamily II)
VNSGPHRPDGTAGDGRNAFIRHLFEEAQDQNLAMLGRQTVKCAMDCLSVLDREVFPAVNLPVRLAIVDRSSQCDPLAEMANGPVACDPIEPGHEGARIRQSCDRSMHVQPNVLEHVFRVHLAFLAEERSHVITQPGCKSFDQLAERSTVAGLAPENQHLLIESVGEVVHAGRRITPEEITDVVVTHMHWDHADGVDLFPKARVWIQREEYDYYTRKAREPGGDQNSSIPAFVVALVNLNKLGRVHLVDGDAKEIIPGVTVYTGGRHTFASQYVGVNTKAGRLVIASDNLYLYENLDKHVPIAQTFDAKSNLAAQDRMKQLATSPRLIIPGHDPAVFVRFPKPGNGVALLE